MTGPTEAAEPQNQIEETYEQRDAFAKWLYWTAYETDTPAGKLARALHKQDTLAFHVIRTRSSYAWPRVCANRKWTAVDPSLLMEVWEQWKAAQL